MRNSAVLSHVNTPDTVTSIILRTMKSWPMNCWFLSLKVWESVHCESLGRTCSAMFPSSYLSATKQEATWTSPSSFPRYLWLALGSSLSQTDAYLVLTISLLFIVDLRSTTNPARGLNRYLQKSRVVPSMDNLSFIRLHSLQCYTVHLFGEHYIGK